MTASEKVLSLLQTLLTHRERQRSVIRPSIVQGRHPDGTESILRLDATCPTRSTPDNHYTGTVVVNPTLAAIHRTGTTGIATLTEIAAAETLWIERLDPADYQPGQTYEVTVTGRGFDTRTHIDFLEPAPSPYTPANTLNPDLEVLSLVVLDSQTLTLHLTVAPTARLYPTGAPIAYGRK